MLFIDDDDDDDDDDVICVSRKYSFVAFADF